MANWTTLKNAIAGIIKTNGNQEITGQILQNVLTNIVSTLGGEVAYGGVAFPNTNPGESEGPLFYIASVAGTYTYFGNAVVKKGEIVLFDNRYGTWQSEKLLIDKGSEIDYCKLNDFDSLVDNTNVATAMQSISGEKLYNYVVTINGKGTAVVGHLSMFCDAFGTASSPTYHLITQVFTTNYIYSNGSFSGHEHAVHTWVRYFGLLSNGVTLPSGERVPYLGWSEWKLNDSGTKLEGYAATFTENVTATASTNGLMSSSDKTKLDGYASTFRGNAVATTSTNGLMSSSDKTKLNGYASTFAQNDTATTSANGLMSSSDKAKLDNQIDYCKLNDFDSLVDNTNVATAMQSISGEKLYNYVVTINGKGTAVVGHLSMFCDAFGTASSPTYHLITQVFTTNYIYSNGSFSGHEHAVHTWVRYFGLLSNGVTLPSGEKVPYLGWSEWTLNDVEEKFKGYAATFTENVTATASTNGLMSSSDKEKLDNLGTRIILAELSNRKFFSEFDKVAGAYAIGWAGALLIDDFSSTEYRDFYCCMTYGQGIVIRHTYATDSYAYVNSFVVDARTTSSSYSSTNKMNSGGWGKYYAGSKLPLAYISRCSPSSSYIHTYYAYEIDTSVTPYKFNKMLTIKYGGSRLAAITSDITVDAEKKYLYVHGYETGSASAITGTSIVMVFNLPEPGASDTITLDDSDILWEIQFNVREAAQDLYVSGGRLYYPYGSSNLCGLAVIDITTGKIIDDIDLTAWSTQFIADPEPEGVALSNGNLYLNYHHAGANNNEVCLVEFPLQDVKEAVKVPSKLSQLANDAGYVKMDADILERLYMYGIEFDTAVSSPECIRIGQPELHRTLPIQSKIRGCLLRDDGQVEKYLNPSTWVGETRDGSKGQVMDEIPEFWIKFEEDGTKRRVKLSEVSIPGYKKVPRMYISAYEATVERSTSKLCSVVNKGTDYRGGDNTSVLDNTYRSLLGMPATKISRADFRNYARNRNTENSSWNCYTYQAHKVLFWLFTVEYATLNSQAGYNAQLTSEGYRQGGLGEGVSNWSSSEWGSFNSSLPFVPCGHTDELGNGTGIVGYTAYNGEGLEVKTSEVPRYRGVENPFGHIWKWADGINVRISPEEKDGGDGLSKVFVCGSPSEFNDTGYDGYEYVGDEARSTGYMKKIIFGEGGGIIPSLTGGSSTQFFCDYHFANIPKTEALRGVMFGGRATDGAIGGLACSASIHVPSSTLEYAGSRLCFIPSNT